MTISYPDIPNHSSKLKLPLQVVYDIDKAVEDEPESPIVVQLEVDSAQESD